MEALVASSLFSSQKIRGVEKFQSMWAMAKYGEDEIHFLLPQTYMNESGRAVLEWKQKYQGESRITVVYDDMDIALGKLRYRRDGSDGGHRGIRSIIECLGTTEIPRLKIGIGRPVDESIDHVLTKFTPDEKVIVTKVLNDVVSQFEILVTDDADAIMQELNGRNYGT